MNRETKFRAWDDNKMIYSDIFQDDRNYSDYDYLKFFFGEIRSDSILMQYINIKDKNGKEIFEGDIVKMISPTFEENERLMVIEYDKNKLSYNFTPNFFLDLEVIGNIFENLELINK
jgi:uncharacterized phage protein (TIGR01671 family)